MRSSAPSARRIGMPSARAFTKRAYQCSLYEAQDVLCDVDDVDLIGLQPRPWFGFQQNWQRRLVYRDVSKKLVFVNPGLHTVRPTGDHELFVAVCQNHWDFLYLNAVKGWKERCQTSVCWLDEFWIADIEPCRNWLDALKQFDYVFLGCNGTVGPLSELLGKECRWLPGAVDVLKFSPFPNPPARTVDVYSIGRRWDGIHRSLLKAADRRDLFYMYDTFPAMANMEPYDPRQHRDHFANVAKRSRFITVAPGKMNQTAETRGQVEIGFRYYEAAAAGAVMIGQPPDCDIFRQTFDWPEAVVPIEPDGSDVVDVINELTNDPIRLDAIGRRNAAGALRRHDWVHRWAEMFRVAGVEPSAGMLARKRRLNDLAEEALRPLNARTYEQFEMTRPVA